jgi:hypothetical protein
VRAVDGGEEGARRVHGVESRGEGTLRKRRSSGKESA